MGPTGPNWAARSTKVGYGICFPRCGKVGTRVRKFRKTVKASGCREGPGNTPAIFSATTWGCPNLAAMAPTTRQNNNITASCKKDWTASCTLLINASPMCATTSAEYAVSYDLLSKSAFVHCFLGGAWRGPYRSSTWLFTWPTGSPHGEDARHVDVQRRHSTPAFTDRTGTSVRSRPVGSYSRVGGTKSGGGAIRGAGPP